MADLPALQPDREEPHMIREDREVLYELKEVTTHVTDFVISILGANPVNPEAQQELAERLIMVGTLLQGHVINGYVNGTQSAIEWVQVNA